MSHIKYHTDAIVFGGSSTGEADRFIWLFTERFGLLGVHARSLRKEKSKQRYALQTLSLSKVSLVRGRNMWRLTNVTPIASLYHEASHEARQSVVRIISLLKRLLSGQEPNRTLYECIKNGIEHLSDLDDVEEAEAFENLTTMRMLHMLGYVSLDKGLQSLLDNPLSITEDDISLAKENRKKITNINIEALQASHL